MTNLRLVPSLSADDFHPPPQPDQQTLKGGGSGGTLPPEMEGRIASLEAHMEHVREDLSVMKVDVGTLKEDVAVMKGDLAHLPTKGFVIGALVTIMGLITGIATLVELLVR